MDKFLQSNPQSMGDWDVKSEVRRTTPRFGWRIPAYPSIDPTILNRLKRSNRYLKGQDLRISRAMDVRDWAKALKLFMWMLRTSRSYRTYAFNRWNSGWYWRISYKRAQIQFKKFEKLCIYLPTKIPMTRKYIPKSTPGKWRPLGIPALEHRILNSCWAQFMYAMFQNSMMVNQHGFRKDRGTWSAWKAIIDFTAQGYKAWEFDLRSFFNTVNLKMIVDGIAKYNKGLSRYVRLVCLESVAKFPEIPKAGDKEYWVNSKLGKNINFIIRYGLPQGLPWSPLLCTRLLKETGLNDMNTVMYADDGIMFTKGNENPLYRLSISDSFIDADIKLAVEKSGLVEDTINFAGASLQLDDRLLKTAEGSWPADKLTIDELKSILGKQRYSKKEPGNWEWDIDPNSWIMTSWTIRGMQWVKWTILFILNSLGQIFLDCKPWNIPKRLRRENWVVYDFISSSSSACGDLLRLRRPKAGVPLRDFDEYALDPECRTAWRFEDNTTKDLEVWHKNHTALLSMQEQPRRVFWMGVVHTSKEQVDPRNQGQSLGGGWIN